MKKYLLLTFISLPLLLKSQNTWLVKSNFPGSSRTAAVAFSIAGKGYLGTGSDWGTMFYSDFWEYDPVADAWSQKASLPAPPRYRAIGFANSTKGYVGTGQTSTLFNDFWEYDPVLNTWTAKSNVGTVGRCSAAGFIIGDKIYVGTGYVPAFTSSKDFWEYDILTDTWSQKADHGGLARSYATGFAIGSKGYLGTGNDSVNFGIGTKDFWEYDPASNTWTQKNNFPGTGRAEAFSFSIGNYGYIGTGTQNWGSAAMADLWKYDPAADSWLQMTPFPGGIREHASCFVIGCKAYVGTGFSNDNSNTLMNDLWEYTPDHTCEALAIFSADNHICPGSCIDFTNLSLNATSFIWSFPGGVPSLSTDANPMSICYNTPGGYDVMLIASNITGSDTLTLVNYITVYPQPAPQGIMQNGDTLFANQGATSYQWFYNGNIIAGATDYFYLATQSGDYNVVATDENDCEVEAVINNVLARAPLAIGSWPLVIYPNPVQDKFIIQLSEVTKGTPIEISIYNTLGEKMRVSFKLYSPGKYEADVFQMPAGIYFLESKSKTGNHRLRFVKE